VRAPRSATVLQVNTREGQYATAGPGPGEQDPLMVLGETVPLHIRIDIDESEIGRAQIGAPATISPRGDAARRVRATYVRTEPLVIPKRSLTNSGNERVDVRVLQLVYALPQEAEGFFVGQQVDAFIPAKQAGQRPQAGAVQGRERPNELSSPTPLVSSEVEKRVTRLGAGVSRLRSKRADWCWHFSFSPAARPPARLASGAGSPPAFYTAPNAAALPAADWWQRRLADPALRRLSKPRSPPRPDLAAALARVEQARAGLRATAAERAPALEGSSSVTYNRTATEQFGFDTAGAPGTGRDRASIASGCSTGSALTRATISTCSAACAPTNAPPGRGSMQPGSRRHRCGSPWSQTSPATSLRRVRRRRGSGSRTRISARRGIRCR
jgi:hypothetical protein